MDLTMFHYFMTHERIVFLFHFTPGSNSSIYVWYSLIDILNIVQRQNMCSSYRGSLRSASLEKLRPGCWKERLRPNIRFCSGCGTADRLFILTVHMCFVFKTAYERVTSPVITSSAKWLKVETAAISSSWGFPGSTRAEPELVEGIIYLIWPGYACGSSRRRWGESCTWVGRSAAVCFLGWRQKVKFVRPVHEGEPVKFRVQNPCFLSSLLHQWWFPFFAFKVWANEYHEYEETSSLLILSLFLMNYLIFSLCSRAECKTFSWIITHSFMRALGADERWNADVWS